MCVCVCVCAQQTQIQPLAHLLDFPEFSLSLITFFNIKSELNLPIKCFWCVVSLRCKGEIVSVSYGSYGVMKKVIGD